jgi:hypothetical protein
MPCPRFRFAPPGVTHGASSPSLELAFLYSLISSLLYILFVRKEFRSYRYKESPIDNYEYLSQNVVHSQKVLSYSHMLSRKRDRWGEREGEERANLVLSSPSQNPTMLFRPNFCSVARRRSPALGRECSWFSGCQRGSWYRRAERLCGRSPGNWPLRSRNPF